MIIYTHCKLLKLRKQMLQLSRERSSMLDTIETYEEWKRLESERESLVRMLVYYLVCVEVLLFPLYFQLVEVYLPRIIS